MAEHQEPTAAVGTDLPLCGIRILDVASFIAAPVAATVLGDYGADVVKVEPVIDGDPNRLISAISPGYPKCSVNYPWHLDSRAKRSLAIDLKNVAARVAFDRLIASADVLITNYPAASRKRLRLTYEDVANVNPRLIYASFTGYGETGPMPIRWGLTPTLISRARAFTMARATMGPRRVSACPRRAIVPPLSPSRPAS